MVPAVCFVVPPVGESARPVIQRNAQREEPGTRGYRSRGDSTIAYGVMPRQLRTRPLSGGPTTACTHPAQTHNCRAEWSALSGFSTFRNAPPSEALARQL